MQPPWQIGPGGLVVSVRLTPKGGRDQMGGVEVLANGRSVLKARVRAAPAEGQANAALIGLLAKALDVPRSRVTLIAGDISRIKRIEIAGNGAALAARLEQLLAEHK